MRTERDRRSRRRVWRKRWRKVKRTGIGTWLLLGLAAAVAVFAAFVVASSGGEHPSASDAPPLKERAQPVERGLLVIGDSWVTGGVMNNGPEWPEMLKKPDGWFVSTDAMGGSGYIGDHANSALTSDGRLDRVLERYNPDAVIVAMGRNDLAHNPDEVIATARDDIEQMQAAWPNAEIVVFSPFSPTPPIEETATLTDRLSGLAESMGLPFVNVSQVIGDRAELITDDHPNDAGHEVIAEYVSDQLRELGVLR